MISEMLFYSLVFLIAANLAALAYKDFRYYILPDVLNASLGILFIAFHLTEKFSYLTPLEIVFGGIAAGLLFLVLHFAAEKFYKSNSLGLGDVKMIAVAGLGLGIHYVSLAITIGALLGVVHGIVLSIIKKQPLSETQVPAGVGFAAGIFATFSYMIF